MFEILQAGKSTRRGPHCYSPIAHVEDFGLIVEEWQGQDDKEFKHKNNVRSARMR